MGSISASERLLADLGHTIVEALQGGQLPVGESFLDALRARVVNCVNSRVDSPFKIQH